MGILDKIKDNNFTHVRVMEGNTGRWVLRAICQECKFEGDFKLSMGHSTCSQEFADRAFKNRKWTLGKDRQHDTCPACVNKAKNERRAAIEAEEAAVAQRALEQAQRKIIPAVAPPEPVVPSSNPVKSTRGSGDWQRILKHIEDMPIGTEFSTVSIIKDLSLEDNGRQIRNLITVAISKHLLRKQVINTKTKVPGRAPGGGPMPSIYRRIQPVQPAPNLPPLLTEGRVQQLVEEGERQFDELIAAVENPSPPPPPPAPKAEDDERMMRWTAKDPDLQALVDTGLAFIRQIRDMEPPEPQKTLDDYTQDELLDALALKRMK